VPVQHLACSMLCCFGVKITFECECLALFRALDFSRMLRSRTPTRAVCFFYGTNQPG
jgi:hypothetical protein